MNLKSIKKVFLILPIENLFLMGAVGCSTMSTQQIMPTPLATAVYSVTSSLSATPETKSTNTPGASSSPIPTSTNQPSLTPEPTQFEIPAIEKLCLQFVDEALPDLTGSLVLSGFRYVPSDYQIAQFDHRESYLLDLETGVSIPLGIILLETVSPDGNWLAYYDTENQVVVVMDRDGNRQTEIPAPDRQLEPAYWLDNQRVLLNNREDNPSSAVDASLVIFNPFTGEQEEREPGFPDQDEARNYPWQVKSKLVFNPTLTEVVYPIDTGLGAIRLWDMQIEDELARVFFGSIVDMPRWNHAGTRFVTNALLSLAIGGETFTNIDDGLPYEDGTELLLVDQTGKVKRLTYLTTSRWVIEHGYVWSPDDQQIVFLFHEPLNNSPVELAVVDVETGNVTNYCELAKLPIVDQHDLLWPPEVVWSPDGEYLAVTYLDGQFNYRVYIVELHSGKAWEVAEDLSVAGWMVSQP